MAHRIGFAEADITAPLGSIIPGGFAARYNTTIRARTFARAVVIGEGEARIAIVTLDVCGIYRDAVERIRERANARCGIAKDAIMVTATHTHTGGPTLDWGEEVVQDPKYIDHIVNASADAICSADNNAAEHPLVNTSCEVDGISFIRVYKMKDGSWKTNPGSANIDKIDCTHTTADKELRVIAAMEGSRPVGAIVNFALHPAILSDNATSGDYIGVLAAELKRVYGPDFVTVFINGACGDINHVNPFDPESTRDGRHEVVGKKLATSVAELLSKPCKSVKGGTSYTTVPVKLGLRRPTKEAINAAYDHIMSLGDKYIDEIPSKKGYQPTFFAMQAMMRMLDKRPYIESSVQVLKFGETFFTGYPVQLFTDFGKATKAALPGAIVSIFANDYLGYGPTPEAMRPGVYEATLCGTSKLTGDAGHILVDAAIEGAKKLQA